MSYPVVTPAPTGDPAATPGGVVHVIVDGVAGQAWDTTWALWMTLTALLSVVVLLALFIVFRALAK